MLRGALLWSCRFSDYLTLIVDFINVFKNRVYYRCTNILNTSKIKINCKELTFKV